MDDQRNDAAPSQQQTSERQSPLPSQTSSQQFSSSSHERPSSQQGRQEVSSVQNSLQTLGSAQPNQLRQEENESSLPPNGSNATHLNTQSSIRDEARVAVVIYDMMMRAGPHAENLSAHLAQAYPVAAALARHYAMYASHLMPFIVQNPIRRRGSLVLRRVSVSSIAWFCSFIASLLALLQLWIIFSLALSAAIASSSDNALLSQVVDHIVSIVIERGPKRQLYRWMFTMLNEKTLVALGTNGVSAAGIQTLMPNQAAAALLMTPVTSAILGFSIGILAALCINSALRATGGIRLDSHED